MPNLVFTAGNISPGADAQINEGVCGEAVAIMKVVYLDAATGQYKLAKNDGTAIEANAVGFAMNTTDAAGQRLSVQFAGSIDIGSGVTDHAVANIYVLNDAGNIINFSEIVSTDKLVILATGLTTTSIKLIPNMFNAGVQKP